MPLLFNMSIQEAMKEVKENFISGRKQLGDKNNYVKICVLYCSLGSRGGTEKHFKWNWYNFKREILIKNQPT